MALSLNEIKTRANAFAKEWHHATNEDSQEKPFLIGFLKYLASPISAWLPLSMRLKSMAVKMAMLIYFDMAFIGRDEITR